MDCSDARRRRRSLRSSTRAAIAELTSADRFRQIRYLCAPAAVSSTSSLPVITVKVVAFGQAVNVTLGLPIVRTSVDHGTAFDIAGKGIADPESMIAAVLLAARLAKNG